MQINEYNSAVKHFLENDALIAKLISQFEAIQLKLKRNYFPSLVTSILSQQLSVHSAKSIIEKFNGYFGKNINPETINMAEFKKLRSLGLSQAKAKYIKDLSSKLLRGDITLTGISNKSEQDIMNELTKVKGIGPWTVHMFMIFVLGRPNILPHGDLGIKKAIMLNYGLKNFPTSDKIINLSKKIIGLPIILMLVYIYGDPLTGFESFL